MSRLLLVGLVIAHPLQVVAQQEELPGSIPAPTVLRWWHGALALGGLSAFMLLDQPLQALVQGERSASKDELAGTLRRFGQIEVYGTVTAGLVAAGVVSGNAKLTRSGGRLAATLAFAGAAGMAGKLLMGRPRPEHSGDADGYVPFSGQVAMPSGHTAMAFAFATALSDDIRRPWATVGLYTLATGVGWSRLNDNRHWLTDVAAGAALGITSAKLMNGRWRMFGLRPPSVLLGPSNAGLAWQVEF
ncbi:MAG TPA: phosphatase PAP2 family protein [Gemmatimonadales bacterium]|nr:phosphatase PAP2 family protein [Gemmatimonadales bacterium]